MTKNKNFKYFLLFIIISLFFMISVKAQSTLPISYFHIRQKNTMIIDEDSTIFSYFYYKGGGIYLNFERNNMELKPQSITKLKELVSVIKMQIIKFGYLSFRSIAIIPQTCQNQYNFDKYIGFKRASDIIDFFEDNGISRTIFTIESSSWRKLPDSYGLDCGLLLLTVH